MSLMSPPHLPRDQRRGRSGSPRSRLRRMQPMEIMYVKRRAALERETMALRATSLPNWMAEMASEMARHRMREFRGILSVGWTYYCKY